MILKTSPTPDEIMKSLATLISVENIQTSMDQLCGADSALQVGKKNKAICRAQKHILIAYSLLREQTKNKEGYADNFKAKITSQ